MNRHLPQLHDEIPKHRSLSGRALSLIVRHLDETLHLVHEESFVPENLGRAQRAKNLNADEMVSDNGRLREAYAKAQADDMGNLPWSRSSSA